MQAEEKDRKHTSRLIGKLLNYETVSYTAAGVLTTAVDYIVFILVNESLKSSDMPSSSAAVIAAAISWLAAVVFAFAANKLIVFRSYDLRPGHVVRELAAFFAARGISGAITVLLIWIMTGPLGLWEYAAKAATSVFNLVFNYIASKFFIFRHKDS